MGVCKGLLGAHTSKGLLCVGGGYEWGCCSPPIGNYGLKLNVKVFNEPFSLDKDTEAFYPARNEEEEEEEEEKKDLLLVGNVTFAAKARLSSNIDDVEYFYTFELSGPMFEERNWSQQPNWTWEIFDLGQYSFTVHAFARLDSNEAHHANFTGQFSLLSE